MNLTLENINPAAMDVDLIGECVAAAAAVLTPYDGFDVVIAADFVSAIRSRTEDERELHRRCDGGAAHRRATHHVVSSGRVALHARTSPTPLPDHRRARRNLRGRRSLEDLSPSEPAPAASPKEVIMTHISTTTAAVGTQ
jgi:hypothetical protein